MMPPKPPARPERTTLWNYLRLFRQDILSAQPAKLYRAWMAEFRTPFFRSFMMNDPKLLELVLKERPDDFPKSNRIREGLAPLLGDSVFTTNGETWKRQRRIIDPAFAGGRMRDTFPAMWAAGQAAATRFDALANAGPVEIEAETSFAAADVIFRTLFSIPIEHKIAAQVFEEFRDYQRTQPLLNLAAFLPLPRWLPRLHRRKTTDAANSIRSLIRNLTEARGQEIAAGTAPDDLATKIMTTADPLTGLTFETEEMVDQVAIFFLAGHETSASALAWTLYLLATHPNVQERLAEEARAVDWSAPDFAALSKMPYTRNVFREALRLYPPVPMMVRENTCPETFRGRHAKAGAQIVLSPWHLHRHERLWDNPDGFDPDRWNTEATKVCARDAYMPFSTGPRVCTGAGFAMIEGVLLLGMLCARLKFTPDPDRIPVPVAHLTVRARDGIYLTIQKR